MIGVLFGLGPLCSAVGAFLLLWSIQSGGLCFPDGDGVFLSFAVSVLVFLVTSATLAPLSKRKPHWRRTVLAGWLVGLVPFVAAVVHMVTYLNGLASGCADGFVPPPW